MRFIVPIVEGRGDEEAAPVLIRRVLYERMSEFGIGVARPKKANGKGNLISRFEDFLSYAQMTEGCAAILVLLDSDGQCPRELGTRLAQRARAIAVGVPVAVVCAKREYENWFLASFEDFQGDAEGFRDAKEWLKRKTRSGLAYKATSNQASFSATMDIDAAFEASRSFRRLCNAVNELVQFVDTGVIRATPGT